MGENLQLTVESAPSTTTPRNTNKPDHDLDTIVTSLRRAVVLVAAVG